MRFTVLGAIVPCLDLACPRDGARVRPAIRSLSVVRQLWRRREWLLELRISHSRAVPGDRERHRRILRSQPVLQSATGRRTPAPAQPLAHGSRAFDTHAAHPSGPGELICRELCCRCTTHERRHAMRHSNDHPRDARLVVDCAGAGARERPALRSLSVVRQLWRPLRRRVELRLHHLEPVHGDSERHRRLLRPQSVLQSAPIVEPLAQAPAYYMKRVRRIDCLRRPCAIAPPCSQGPSTLRKLCKRR